MQDQPVLLFDVMDTLVYNPFNQEIPAHFGLTPSALAEQKHPTAWVEFESGRISEAEYLRIYFNDGRAFDHADFQTAVRAAYRWIEGTEQLLGHLRHQGYEIHAFSNYPIWYRTIETKLGLSRFLQWTFVSCLTGVRKPEPEAYLGVSRVLNRSLADCLLIDDRSENCLAARTQGMQAIHYLDTASLWEELLARGLVE